MHSRLGLSIAFGALCLTNSSPIAAAEDPALAHWINASEVNLRT